MALFQFVISMPASVNKYERQSCRKERLKHTRKSDTKSTVENMWKFNVSKYEIKKRKKKNSQNDIPKDRHLSIRVGSQRLCTSCFTVFFGSHRQGVFGHRGFNIASQRLLWILESQSVASILLQQMSYIWWPYDNHIMTPFRIIHLCYFHQSTCISFPNLVGVFM